MKKEPEKKDIAKNSLKRRAVKSYILSMILESEVF